MQLDVIILIIIAIFTILGFKNGFVHTVFFTLGWFISIAIAFFTRDEVKDFLTNKTPVYDWYYDGVYDVCMKFVTTYTDKMFGGAEGSLGGAAADATSGGAMSGALDAIGGAAAYVGEKAGQEVAEQIASASFGVFSFIGTVLVIKLILFLITLLLSRKYRGGFVGALDATGGLIIGIVQGFIVVFVMLILIMPISLAISPGLFETVSHTFDTSMMAKTLFLENPLVSLIDGFSPDIFDPEEWIGKIE